MMFFEISSITDIQESDFNRVLGVLSEEQSEYLLRINENKRKQSIAVRALLLNMLENHYPHISISSLSFNDNGAPCFKTNPDIYVSFTHSGSYIGCALSNRPVGIDIERIRLASEKLISRICTREEKDYIKKQGEDCFFTVWTLKEAYIKAKQCSFSEIFKLSFIKNGVITDRYGKVQTGGIKGYKWSLIEL